MKKNNFYSIISHPTFIAAFLFVILVCIAFHPYLSYDELLWGYIGRIWQRNGLPPYIVSVENKTPGNFILFAISEYFDEYNFIFARLMGAISVVVSSIFIYKIAKVLHGKLAGVIAMYILGLTFCWEQMDGFSLAQTETFMVMFSILGFYALIKSKSYSGLVFNKTLFMAGLFMGLAISFKQIAVTTFVAFFLFYLIYFKGSKAKYNQLLDLGLFVFGTITSMFLIYFILLLNEVSFKDYIDGAWSILLNSGSRVPQFNIRFKNFTNVFLVSRFVVFYSILILLFFQKEEMKKKYFIGVLIWLIIDFVGVNSSGYYYGHQIKQLLPPLILISAIVLSEFFSKKIYLGLDLRKTIFLIVIIILFFPYVQLGLTLKKLYQGEKVKPNELGIWIKNNTKKTDNIYVLGGDVILMDALYFSDRISSSKYFNSIFITGQSQREQVFNDLKRKPPVYILKEPNSQFYKNKYGDKIVELVKDNYSIFKVTNQIQVLKRNIQK